MIKKVTLKGNKTSDSMIEMYKRLDWSKHPRKVYNVEEGGYK